jgi:hypothetical protein
LAKDKKPKEAMERRQYQILKPAIVLTAAEGYPETREIGGVRVELAAIPPQTQPRYFVAVQGRETALESWAGIRLGNAAPVWVAVLPFYTVEPKNLQFRVKVTNHLGKVLRLDGVALQFQKDGSALDVASTANTLQKVIILPEKSWEGVLQGPPLQAFGLKEFDARAASGGTVQDPITASEGVLLLGLYDVITELDAASTPKVRSNFEWVFAYQARAEPEAAEALRWKARMTPEDAQRIVGDRTAEELARIMPTDAR